MGDPLRTYDRKQREAVLVTCISCERSYYMTHPQQPCALCRDEAARVQRQQEAR